MTNWKCDETGVQIRIATKNEKPEGKSYYTWLIATYNEKEYAMTEEDIRSGLSDRWNGKELPAIIRYAAIKYAYADTIKRMAELRDEAKKEMLIESLAGLKND